MSRLAKLLKRLLKYRERPASTLVLVSVVLLASWMGYAHGGYFVGDWAPVVYILATLMLLASVTGVLGCAPSWWSIASTSLLTGYAAWTFVSLLWSPNRGDAWYGANLTLFYLLVFWVVLAFVTLGAARRWALAASAFGPALIAAFTLSDFATRTEDLFVNNRLIGTVSYYNAEAAFLLLPFWAGVYVAGSRRVNPSVRAVVLAGTVLCAEVAVLTQSRGAMVAMALSLPIFFLFSGKRLRGLFALAPIAVSLFIAFPELNKVYLDFLDEGSLMPAIEEARSIVWLTAAGSGLYGLLWGLADRRWNPPAGAVRVFGAVALAGTIAAFAVGGFILVERAGNPIALGQEKWEAFKTDETAGQEQSRYLNASGSGRYALWEVAWKDFVSKPVLGVGTYNYEATYYRLREQPVGYVRFPHMLPLEVLAERGVIGGALFLGFLGVCLAAGLHRRFTELNAEGRAQVGAIIAGIGYWCVHSSAEWFWQIPAVTMPVVIYLALLVAPWDQGDGTEDVPTGWPLRAAGAGIAVLMMATVTPIYVSDRYVEQSLASTDPRSSLASIERAQDFYPLNPQLAQREAELAARIEDWPRATQAYARAIRLNPEHYAPYALSASFYERRGRSEEALSLYQKALKRNPLEPELKENVYRLQQRVESQ